jgi:hypothetical protein
LERAVVKGILDRLFSTSLISLCCEEANKVLASNSGGVTLEISATEKKIAQYESVLSRLVTAIESGAQFEQIRGRVGEIQEKLAAAQAELDKLRCIAPANEIPEINLEDVPMLLEDVLSGERSPAARSAVRSLIENITVEKGKDGAEIAVKLSPTEILNSVSQSGGFLSPSQTKVVAGRSVLHARRATDVANMLLGRHGRAAPRRLLYWVSSSSLSR